MRQLQRKGVESRNSRNAHRDEVIMQLWRGGMKMVEIASIVGITDRAVSYIVKKPENRLTAHG